LFANIICQKSILLLQPYFTHFVSDEIAELHAYPKKILLGASNKSRI